MCFNVKSLTYYFHMKMKILADFKIYISAPLIFLQRENVKKKIYQKTLILVHVTNCNKNMFVTSLLCLLVV